MRAKFFTYTLPICLSIITIAAIVILKKTGSIVLPQIPYDLHLFGALIYATVLRFGLQDDLREKTFWRIIQWSIGINFIGAVLRTYVWPFLNMPDIVSELTLVLYIVAMLLIIVALFKVMNILGINPEKKSRTYLNISYIIIFVILLAILAPIIIKTGLKIESIVTYVILVVFCALSIPLAVALYVYTKTGALRIPFLFISLGIVLLSIQVTAITFALAASVEVPVLEFYVFIPYVLFVMFAMMAFASRITITRKAEIFLKS